MRFIATAGTNIHIRAGKSHLLQFPPVPFACRARSRIGIDATPAISDVKGHADVLQSPFRLSETNPFITHPPYFVVPARSRRARHIRLTRADSEVDTT
jgi:hypothetical protein